MKPAIKTAIASFGMSGQVFHGPFLKTNPGYEVISVLERSKTLSRKLFPQAAIVDDYKKILKNPDIELVIVNTPDRLHFEMAAAALKSGKHVVVEKPLTQKSQEAKQLVQLSREKGKILAVFQNRRWDGDFLTVQKILGEGKLGRLVEFESHYDRYRTQITPGTWKEEGDEYAGVLYNLGSHMVDQAFVLFGKPKAVTAHLKIVRTGGAVSDYYDIRLEYGKFTAILKCSYLVKEPGPRYIIHGEMGSFFKFGIDPQEEMLKAGNLPEGEKWGIESADLWGTLYYSENENSLNEKIETVQGNYHSFYNNVFETVRNGTELMVKPEETIEVLKILEACLLSNREKRTIML
ncbi:MAG TPA: oxidoreductase [Prolixibacteraceae bacterium]|nr:oxidoreductase [Prolixibacteraceae bacterium]